MIKILVLPFRIDPSLNNNTYLQEGILEEFIDEFSNQATLQCCSRSSSLYFDSNPLPCSELEKRFDVTYLVEGHIKQNNTSEKTITIRVLKTSNEFLLMNEKQTFSEHDWTNQVYSIVQQITSLLFGKSVINHSEASISTKTRELFLKGMYHWHRYTHEELLKAISYFKQAIKENSSYVLPYAYIANSYSIIGIMGYDVPNEQQKLAKKYVQKALSLDGKNTEVFVAAAMFNIFYDRDFEQAKSNLNHALKLNAKNENVQHLLAMYYIYVGELDKAEKHSKITIKSDPLSLPYYALLIRILIGQKKYEQAMDYVNAAMLINNEAIPVIELKAQINLFSGNIEAAIIDFKYCKKQQPNNAFYYAYLALAYDWSNFYADSLEIEQQLETLNIPNTTGILDYARAIIKIGRQDHPGFYYYINKALQTGLGELAGALTCHPLFDNYRKDAPFIKLLQEQNLFTQQKKPLRKASSLITIHTNTNETISLDPQDINYIESQDNYSFVHWFENQRPKKTMLRVTLKQLEQQLSKFNYFIRCHKSFIVNIDRPWEFIGNTKAYFFKHASVNRKIPISRSKNEHIKTLLKN